MIIFLYGDDDFRAKQKLSEIKNDFNKKVDLSGDSLSFLDGEKIKMDELNTSVNSPSLFSRRRMIVVDGLFRNKDKEIFIDILNFVKKKSEANDGESNVLVFIDTTIGQHPTKARKELWAFLVSQKFSQSFKILSNTELSSWIKNKAKKRGAEISLQNSTELASMLDNDLWRINSELEKLVNYISSQKLLEGGKVEISRELITEMVSGSFDDNIFILTEAMGTGDKKKSLSIIEEQLSGGVSFEYLLSMIVWQFKKLVLVKQVIENGANPKQVATELKIHPFVAQKSMAQVRKYSLEDLKKILINLILITKRARENSQDALVELNILITRM